jgi:spore germination protein D
MKIRTLLLTSIFLYFIFLFGCAPQEQGNGQMDYEQTKKMVVDILKTDEGKKAIQEIMADDKMKQALVMDQKVVSETIEKTLTSDKGTDFWKKAFEDPKFAETFAKSMQKEHEKLMKGLMKDPDYQGMMMDIFKDPEVEKEILNLIKSKEYRQHLQHVMTETFESPLFKAKIQEILLKAASEMPMQQEGQQKQEQGGGGGQSSGGGGAGGG